MSASGHEERFRRIYADEAGARLARLSRAVLDLESRSRAGMAADPELIDAMFRDAHTLKGGAAVVGLQDASRVAHALEDLLEALRAGDRTPTGGVIDVLLSALDGFPALLEPGGGGVADDLVSALRDEATARGQEIVRLPDAPRRPSGGPLALLAPPRVQSAPVRTTEPSLDEAEVVRVPLPRLEALTRLAAASSATQQRLGRSLLAAWKVDPGELEEFRELTQLLGELQEQTLRTRMVPVVSMLQSLQRVVRETARALGKQARWELHGGATELDRGVLEQLGDPLLHLIRNAVCHGLESPEERSAAGKDPVGTVRLTAAQRGPEVMLSLLDDGRGIDVERVRDEARLHGRETEGLSDSQAAALVFTSGLTTADTITPLAGRGVGLDVVSSVLRRIRGRVEVSSAPGAGSQFRIIVPLTMALLPCMIAEAGEQRFALPLHAVVTALPPPAVGRRRDVVRVDGRVVPWWDLGEVLGLPPARQHPSSTGASLVLSDGARAAAFGVDRLGDQRNVLVKGPSPLLPRLDAIAGASVELDGSILIVLEPSGLLDRAQRLPLAV